MRNYFKICHILVNAIARVCWKEAYRLLERAQTISALPLRFECWDAVRYVFFPSSPGYFCMWILSKGLVVGSTYFIYLRMYRNLSKRTIITAIKSAGSVLCIWGWSNGLYPTIVHSFIVHHRPSPSPLSWFADRVKVNELFFSEFSIYRLFDYWNVGET